MAAILVFFDFRIMKNEKYTTVYIVVHTTTVSLFDG